MFPDDGKRYGAPCGRRHAPLMTGCHYTKEVVHKNNYIVNRCVIKCNNDVVPINCDIKVRQAEEYSVTSQGVVTSLGALRSTVNRSKGLTPNMIMLGREVCLPVNLMLGSSSPDIRHLSPREYVIIEVLSPVWYRVQDRRRESVVHHDRLQHCHDRYFPRWMQQFWHNLLNTVMD